MCDMCPPTKEEIVEDEAKLKARAEEIRKARRNIAETYLAIHGEIASLELKLSNERLLLSNLQMRCKHPHRNGLWKEAKWCTMCSDCGKDFGVE